MLEDYLVQQPTMAWNTKMKWWDTSQVDILLQLSLPFLGTWQTSGMMRNGQVFELPMREHRTTDSEFSSSPILRTPAASEAERGHQPEDKSRARGGQVTLSGQMMTYFPTPNTMDHLPARTPEQKEANKGKGGYANVRETVINDLLRTPNAMDGDKGSYATATERLEQGRQVKLHNEINEIGTNWGKFEPAIRRWEETLGRPAPAPTKADGKDGAHRLSSAFTEWMMGLPEASIWLARARTW